MCKVVAAIVAWNKHDDDDDDISSAKFHRYLKLSAA